MADRFTLRQAWGATGLLLSTLLATSCQSPYYTDRGALAGGLGGAGVGALVGQASGNALAGAAIGTGVGAVTGSLIGSGLDDIEARNQARFAAAQASRQFPAGVSTNDVIAMSKSGVDEGLVINHIHANGVARPLAAGEIIALQQEGVSTRVIAAMQTGGPAGGPVGVPAPLVAGGYYYPYPPPVYWAPPPPPPIGIGFSYRR